jgi:hypothetical protein
VSPPGMVETPRLQPKRSCREMAAVVVGHERVRFPLVGMVAFQATRGAVNGTHLRDSRQGALGTHRLKAGGGIQSFKQRVAGFPSNSHENSDF